MLKMKFLLVAGFIVLAGSVSAKPYGAGSVAPMPNLMPVIMHHGDMLDLSEAQEQELAKWRKENHHGQHELSNQIREKQATMRKAALDGEPAEALLTMEQDIEAMRIKFISKKAACRDNMKKVLNPEQWQKVVEIYRQENGVN